VILRRIFVLLALAQVVVCAQAVKLDALDKLSEKASETVTVSLDANLLKLASKFLSNDDPDQASVRKLVASLKGVYVRNFQFDKAGDYLPADLDPIRAQLRDPKWKKIVEVRSRTENADVMLRQEDENNISGLAVIVTEPTELTVVYIDGPVDLEGLSKLSGNFGIPEDLGPKLEKAKEKEKEKKSK
jgi:hypothetical protein